MKSQIKKTGLWVYRFTRGVVSEFTSDQCLIRAPGLAFSTLLALVPLSALILSLIPSVSSFDGVLLSIQKVLVRQLVPTMQDEIMGYINLFIDNTNALGVVGLLFFLSTSVMLFASIRNNFCAIWGTPPGRNPLLQFMTYASILTVGGFLISIGLYFTGLFESFFPMLAANFPFVTKIFPTALTFLIFLLLVVFIPNDRISWISGAIGALVGTLLWEIARVLFAFWVTSIIKLSVIYGSLAVIPIFLIWLYLAWAIVLLSLEITKVHQHRVFFLKESAPNKRDAAQRFLQGIKLYFVVARHYANGLPPLSSRDLAKTLGVSIQETLRYVDMFSKSRLLLPAGPKAKARVPSKSLDRIMMMEIITCLAGSTPSDFWGDQHLKQLGDTLANVTREKLEGVSVAEYLGLS